MQRFSPRCKRGYGIFCDVRNRIGDSGDRKIEPRAVAALNRGVALDRRFQQAESTDDEARKAPTSNPTFSATARNALGRHETAKCEEQLAS